MRRHDDDRMPETLLLEAVQQLQPVHARHPHIGENAPDALLAKSREGVEKGKSRWMGCDTEAGRMKQHLKCQADSQIIVDDMHNVASAAEIFWHLVR
jgi:hypothetical protein